jgi:hypothetical protein
MESFSVDLPFLFGDHHVIEVRKLISELPGVQDVYASSSFHMVEVKYDPALLDPQLIMTTLQDAGYLGDTSMPVETGVTSGTDNMNSPFFRRSNVNQNTPKVVSFSQIISASNRHIWPCPGLGPVLSVKNK